MTINLPTYEQQQEILNKIDNSTGNTIVDTDGNELEPIFESEYILDAVREFKLREFLTGNSYQGYIRGFTIIEEYDLLLVRCDSDSQGITSILVYSLPDCKFVRSIVESSNLSATRTTDTGDATESFNDITYFIKDGYIYIPTLKHNLISSSANQSVLCVTRINGLNHTEAQTQFYFMLTTTAVQTSDTGFGTGMRPILVDEDDLFVFGTGSSKTISPLGSMYVYTVPIDYIVSVFNGTSTIGVNGKNVATNAQIPIKRCSIDFAASYTLSSFNCVDLGIDKLINFINFIPYNTSTKQFKHAQVSLNAIKEQSVHYLETTTPTVPKIFDNLLLSTAYNTNYCSATSDYFIVTSKNGSNYENTVIADWRNGSTLTNLVNGDSYGTMKTESNFNTFHRPFYNTHFLLFKVDDERTVKVIKENSFINGSVAIENSLGPVSENVKLSKFTNNIRQFNELVQNNTLASSVPHFKIYEGDIRKGLKIILKVGSGYSASNVNNIPIMFIEGVIREEKKIVGYKPRAVREDG